MSHKHNNPPVDPSGKEKDVWADVPRELVRKDAKDLRLLMKQGFNGEEAEFLLKHGIRGQTEWLRHGDIDAQTLMETLANAQQDTPDTSDKTLDIPLDIHDVIAAVFRGKDATKAEVTKGEKVGEGGMASVEEIIIHRQLSQAHDSLAILDEESLASKNPHDTLSARTATERERKILKRVEQSVAMRVREIAHQSAEQFMERFNTRLKTVIENFGMRTEMCRSIAADICAAVPVDEATLIRILSAYLSISDEKHVMSDIEYVAANTATITPRLRMYGATGHSILMDLIRGKDVAIFLRDTREISARTHLVWQCAQAASLVADSHIAHLDIKPTNFFVDENGSVKILDFGISQHMEDARSRQSEDTISGGTPSYMPPERTRGITHQRSDVYSMASMLFEALTGSVPNRAFIQEDKKVAIVERRMQQATNDDIQKEIDAALIENPRMKALLLRSLDIDPEKRPSMRAFTQQLKNILDTETTKRNAIVMQRDDNDPDGTLPGDILNAA